MSSLLRSKAMVRRGSNNFDPFVPEWWANETLAILEENMVIANLVHRDFEPYFQNAGDIVNTRRPSEFTAVRKAPTDNITIQDATATNVPVTLDQHIHVSFQVNDVDQRRSMVDLITTYIKPAALALARNADRVILGQYPRFLPNVTGKLRQGSQTNGYMLQNLANLKVRMDIQKAYEDGRKLILSPLSQALLLGSPEMYKVLEAGTSAPRVKGLMGTLMNFDLYSAQNMADILLNPAGITKTATLNAAVLAGATTITSTGWGAATDFIAGDWVEVNGFPTPVVSVSGSYSSSSTVMTVVVRDPLPFGAATSTVMTGYKAILVNNVAGYAAGWNKPIEWDTTGATTGYEPQVGQSIQLGGATGAVYTVIAKPTATSILLDRSLEVAVLDNAKIQPLPHGSYSLAFHRNAITAAIRPLAPVPAGAGVKSQTINYNGFTLRATMGYDINSQNMIVTLDFLMGIQVLDTNLGALLLA